MIPIRSRSSAIGRSWTKNRKERFQTLLQKEVVHEREFRCIDVDDPLPGLCKLAADQGSDPNRKLLSLLALKALLHSFERCSPERK